MRNCNNVLQKLQTTVILLFLCCVTAESKDLGRFKAETWRMVEITLQSEIEYKDPFNDVVVEAFFKGPKGIVIRRYAFWDGDNNWKIRFAPPEKGLWRMETISNQEEDKGLHSVKCRVRCRKYKGELEIFKHGFVKVANSKRYFVYDDGTPFFYLGDTHWCFIHERFNTSNVEGIESQFKYAVDKRVKQGFTVYQSEAIQNFDDHKSQYKDEEARCSFNNGFGEDDLPGFRNLDRKFEYIAQCGLLHANSQICWATDPTLNRRIFTNDYMYKLGRYWSARYGAYPVLWTVAQEVDKNLYGRLTESDLGLWISMAEGLTANDSYHHPLSAHMEEDVDTDANSSSWGELFFHKWWAIQWKGTMTTPRHLDHIKTFWYYNDVKPCILYESGYEHLAVDATSALRQGFIAFQSGLFGYGYGANGVWNDLYDESDIACNYHMPQQYLHWYKGVNLEGAELLNHLKSFYQSINWWELEPHYNNKEWFDLIGSGSYALSSIGNTLFLVYLWNDSKGSDGKLKQLKKGVPYMARWYNPLEGKYYEIGKIMSSDGEYTIPIRPTQGDWMFVLEEK